MLNAPYRDQSLRAIAEYLQATVNVESQSKWGIDAIAGIEVIEPWFYGRDADANNFLPLLRICRLSSNGKLGDDCSLLIGVFLPFTDKPQEQEGFSRWLELRIRENLNEFFETKECFQLKNPPSVAYGVVQPLIEFRFGIKDWHRFD